MSTKVRNLKAEVLSWLRHGYADDPECGTMSPNEIAGDFGVPATEVENVLQALYKEGKVGCTHRGLNTLNWEYYPTGGRIVFDD